MFHPALSELDASGTEISAPESFTKYCVRTKQKKPTDVPGKISVQSLGKLDKDLRDAGVMVFRLGSPPRQKTTNFGLARCVDDWGDYFIIDETVFANCESQAFIPSASYRELYAFSLLPRFTETTLVNYALASGLLEEALQLDRAPSIPVTGQSTYTFTLYPRLKEDGIWTHHAGQVEIDAAFTSRRKGRDCLFIVEAKHGPYDSLAKTKLLYPYLSLRPHVPENMPIVLIYMRAVTNGRQLDYSIAECTVPPHDHPSPLGMDAHASRRLTVNVPGG